MKYTVFILSGSLFVSHTPRFIPIYRTNQCDKLSGIFGAKYEYYTLMGRFQSQVTVRSMSSMSVMQIGCSLQVKLMLINPRSYTRTKLYTTQISKQ
jgi:hypothetical protein